MRKRSQWIHAAELVGIHSLAIPRLSVYFNSPLNCAPVLECGEMLNHSSCSPLVFFLSYFLCYSSKRVSLVARASLAHLLALASNLCSLASSRARPNSKADQLS